MNLRPRALAVLGVAALTLLVVNVVVLRGGRAAPRPGDEERAPDCALVLGARVYEDGTPSPVLRDRLDEGITLYQEKRVSRILVSGDHAGPTYDEPNAMRTYLESNGIPREVIFMDHAGLDTYSSMWRAKHVFGASRVVVVTQQFHLPRAVWLARSVGLKAEGRAADRRSYRGIAWQELREVGSRTKAFFDVAMHRRPRFAGPAIDLEGGGSITAG